MARNKPQTLLGRIAGATKSYMGNTRNHSLEPGNKMADHNKVYRQIRKSMGLSAG